MFSLTLHSLNIKAIFVHYSINSSPFLFIGMNILYRFLTIYDSFLLKTIFLVEAILYNLLTINS